MRVGGGAGVLPRQVKRLLDAILRALPEHVAALAAPTRSIARRSPCGCGPSTRIPRHEVLLSAGADGSAVLSPVRATVGRCARVAAPTATRGLRAARRHRHVAVVAPLVLLVTDGGATQRERFFGAIEAIASQPGVGFFQCDALGAGRGSTRGR